MTTNYKRTLWSDINTSGMKKKFLHSYKDIVDIINHEIYLEYILNVRIYIGNMLAMKCPEARINLNHGNYIYIKRLNGADTYTLKLYIHQDSTEYITTVEDAGELVEFVQDMIDTAHQSIFQTSITGLKAHFDQLFKETLDLVEEMNIKEARAGL